MEANLENVSKAVNHRPWPALAGGPLPVKGMNGDNVTDAVAAKPAAPAEGAAAPAEGAAAPAE